MNYSQFGNLFVWKIRKISSALINDFGVKVIGTPDETIS